MTTRHVTLLAIAACGGVPPPAAPPPRALIAVEQAPRITVVDQRLATTPCPPARELGPGTRAIAIGGTRVLDVESASVVSLADRSAVVIANVVCGFRKF